MRARALFCLTLYLQCLDGSGHRVIGHHRCAEGSFQTQGGLSMSSCSGNPYGSGRHLEFWSTRAEASGTIEMHQEKGMRKNNPVRASSICKRLHLWNYTNVQGFPRDTLKDSFETVLQMFEMFGPNHKELKILHFIL